MVPALRLVSGDHAPPGPYEGNGHSAKPGNGSEHKPTLLIVEDEILIRLVAADFLRTKGYRILEASNAAEALSIFAAGEPIELVFSDIDMPGKMNGGALAQWIQKYFPDVKIILTSGDSASAEESSIVAECGPFLKKPYSHETLLVQIKRLLAA